MDKKENALQRPGVILALALLCTALWGSASPGIKISYDLFRIEADDLFSKCLMAGLRFVVAGSLIIIFDWLKNRRVMLPPKKELPKLAALGLLQTSLQYLMFYTGLAYTSAAKGALFSSLDGFFIVLISPFIIKGARLTGLKILGCVLGLAGLILTSAGTDLSLLAGFNIRGEGAVIMSSLCFAMGFFPAKRLMRRMSPAMVTGWSITIGAAVLLIVGIIGGGRMYMGGGTVSFLVFAYLCLLSTVAYTVWSVLMKYNPVNRVSILKLFTPIFGAVFSALILKEKSLGLINVISLALVCSGIWCVNKEA